MSGGGVYLVSKFSQVTAILDSFAVFCSSPSSGHLRVFFASLSADIESRIVSLSVTVAYLAVLIQSLLAALTAYVFHPSLPQVTSQAWLEPDVHDPHPGSSAGYHRSHRLWEVRAGLLWSLDAPLYVSQGVRAHLLSGQTPHPLF